MNITEIASQLFLDQIPEQSSKPSVGVVQEGLSKLLPSNQGELDIPSLVSKFMGQGGLASLASSWLGDGGNASLSIEKVLDLLGQSQVNDFANKLGLDTNVAVSALSDMIPQLIDKASSGGALKSDLGESLISGLAGKLFS